MNHYDVIVVGGRPAGSTLAARLGMAGLRVLVVERAKLPSLPGASCPIIYSPTMAMLDEIGADEAAYARSTPPIRRMVNNSEGLLAEVPIPMAHGRDYGYAIDRARFDHALWENALRFPTVEGRDQYSVVDLIWEGERVAGIVGQRHGGPQETITADLVIGADGRFSTVARKAGAAERDERDEFPTSIYYAYWTNVKPYDDQGAVAMAHGPGMGYGFLVMESADGRTVVAVEGQSALIDPPPGKASEWYVDFLKQHPVIWARVKDAERVTDVRGMKRIGNLYRAPGGQGWALVGDAYHQKDPIDGQGIFDAVYTARLLADAVTAWKSGAMTWEAALKRYDQQARAETFPMYKATLERVRATLYSKSPDWLVKLGSRTFLRWLLEDRLCQEQLGMMLTRQLPADQMMSPPIVVGALLRGPLRDISNFLDRQIQD